MRREGEGDAAEAAPRLKEVAGADSDRLNGMLLRAVLGCLPHPAAEAPRVGRSSTREPVDPAA